MESATGLPAPKAFRFEQCVLPPSPFETGCSSSQGGLQNKISNPNGEIKGDVTTVLSADATSIVPRMVSWNEDELVSVREYEISETCPSEDWEYRRMKVGCCTLQ